MFKATYNNSVIKHFELLKVLPVFSETFKLTYFAL